MGLYVSEGSASAVHTLVTRLDWDQSPLGAREQWPARLVAAWDLVSHCPVPMALLCGPSFSLLYNDAFGELLGDRHRPVAEHDGGAALVVPGDDAARDAESGLHAHGSGTSRARASPITRPGSWSGASGCVSQ